MYKRTFMILSCGGGGKRASAYGRCGGRWLWWRLRLGGGAGRGRRLVQQVARAAAASCSRIERSHCGGLGVLLRVLFAEAVRRRRAAITNLFEQRTESMLVVFLSGFGSRVAGGMRHSWLHSASGPRRARAAAPLASSDASPASSNASTSNWIFQKKEFVTDVIQNDKFDPHT